MKDKIEQELLALMEPRRMRFDLTEKEIRGGLDLVRSGFVNSMEFVELIAELEKKTGLRIDYEEALSDQKFTTFTGIVKAFEIVAR